MISVLHPRDMEQPVVTLDKANGWFQHKRPLTLRPVKVVSWSNATVGVERANGGYPVFADHKLPFRFVRTSLR